MYIFESEHASLDLYAKGRNDVGINTYVMCLNAPPLNLLHEETIFADDFDRAANMAYAISQEIISDMSLKTAAVSHDLAIRMRNEV